jgi:ABC-2 type transport system permease protein
MFFASVFMAVGASVSQLKEAQSMLLPVWMVMMIPFFVWFNVVREPNSTLAVAISFFPPATPGMMVLRLATGQTIPMWQPILGMIESLLATILCVLVSARIFRAGLLWQGKTPKLSEILRWAIHG